MSALSIDERFEVTGGLMPAPDVARAGWLSREVVATELGVSRLRRWAASGCPEAVPGDLHVIGEGYCEILVAALEKMPPPVAHHLVERSVVLTMRPGVGGTAYNAYELEGRMLIVLTDSTGRDDHLVTLFAHESAHRWLHNDESPQQVPTAAEKARREAGMQRIASDFDAHDQLESVQQQVARKKERIELEACALVRAWGFTGPAAYHNRRRRR